MRRLVGICLVAVLAFAGCGIPLEESPTRLSEVPDSLALGRLPTPTPVPAGELQTIFMVGSDDRLVPVLREAVATPQAVVESLMQNTTPAEAADSISTALSRRTDVVDVGFNPLFKRATVTLSSGITDSQPRDQLLAFGQFVFTLTELDDVQEVLFRVVPQAGTFDDAVALAVQTDVGPTEPGAVVTRANFASIDPGGRLSPVFEEDQTADPGQQPRETFDVAIWLVDADNKLVPVTRQIEGVDRASALLLSLFDDRLSPASVAAGLRSAIPLDAEARNFVIEQVERADGITVNIAQFDLPGDRNLPAIEEGDERLLAVAQIVYTLTGLAEVDQVLISIETQFVPMPTQFGDSEPFNSENPVGLQRSDYAALADITVIDRVPPTPEPSTEPTPAPTSTPDP